MKKADIFAVGVGFNVEDNNKEFGTAFGGIVFICYLIFCLYFIITNFFDFADRSIFNQNIMETKSDTAPPLNLLNSKMAFALTITINGSPNDSDPIFEFISFKIKHVSKYKETGKKEKIYVNMTQCTKELFHNAINESFDISSLENYLCIDPHNNGNNNLTLRGIYTEELFQYLELSVNINDNGMTQAEFIHQYLLENEIKLQMYYLDSSINVNRYSSPEKLYLNSKFLKLSFPFIEKANADFSNNTFDNDANIIFTSSSIFHFYTLDIFDQTNEFQGMSRLTDKKGDYDLLGRLYIRSSQMSVVYKRTYQKFTEYLADSTAIVSQVLFILVLVIGQYDQFKVKEYIIDNVLKYKVKYIKKNPKGFNKLKGLFSKRQKDTTRLKTEKDFTLIDEDLMKNSNSNYVNTNTILNPNEYEQINTLEFSNKIINGKKHKKGFKSDFQIKTSQDSLNSEQKLTKESDTRDKISTKDLLILDKNVPLYVNYLSDNLKKVYKQKCLSKSKNNTNESLVFSFKDMLKALFFTLGCCKKDKHIKQKQILFEKGEERYLYNLDIFTYFTKMREIDLLKYILIPSDKKPIIDFLTKPSISLLSKDKECPLPQTNTFVDNTLNNVNEFYFSFNRCSEEYLKKKREHDKKILGLASYEIFQLLEDDSKE